MQNNIHEENQKELQSLCNLVRELTYKNQYKQCREAITSAMRKYPHAPEPHNLFGVLLEKRGDHSSAMKHFRAAWALDPTYIPARYNLNIFSSFTRKGSYAFDESDCALISENNEKDLTKNDGGETF